MVRTNLTSETILAIQRDISDDYPDTTIHGDTKHKPGFVDYIISHTETWDALAARLLFNISNTHPFPDGNKRTAVTVTAVACIESGYTIDAEHLRELVLEIARNQVDDPEVVQTKIKSNSHQTNTYDSLTSCSEIAKTYREHNKSVFDRLSTE